MDAEKVIWPLASFAVVQFVALIVALVKMMSRVSYVEGRMEHFDDTVDKTTDEMADLAKDVAMMSRTHLKTELDVNSAFDKVRRLEGDMISVRTEVTATKLAAKQPRSEGTPSASD